MAAKQISEALFKQIVKGLEKLGISLSEVLGTRTGVKKNRNKFNNRFYF